MQKQITFIGGDLRNAKLIEMFAKDNYKIYTYGFEKYNFNNDVIKNEKLKISTDIIISAIPFSKDGIFINEKFSNQKIKIEELFQKAVNKKIIAGAVKEHIINVAKEYNIEITDILNNEELTILNVIPTAEGAIQIAMEESEETIHGSNCMVLGFGRIGKILSKMLFSLGAKVYCEARKPEDLAYIEAYGYEKVNLKNLNSFLPKCKYIFNTIPNLILDKQRLDYIKSDALIIDLASSPGGVDFEYAQKIGVKAILALGLPGKVAPLTAAKYIKNVLEKVI